MVEWSWWLIAHCYAITLWTWACNQVGTKHAADTYQCDHIDLAVGLRLVKQFQQERTSNSYLVIIGHVLIIQWRTTSQPGWWPSIMVGAPSSNETPVTLWNRRWIPVWQAPAAAGRVLCLQCPAAAEETNAPPQALRSPCDNGSVFNTRQGKTPTIGGMKYWDNRGE